MNVTLDSHTLRPLEVCAVAARTCYSSDNPEDIELSYEQQIKLIRQVIKSGHLSVLEHANFTFHISGVSRSLTHQLVRHRLASYSQTSQRYVSMQKADYVTPKTIQENVLVNNMYNDANRFIWKIYEEMIKSGIPKEDARYILPNACTTNIVVTMNARELFHFFELRLCGKSQWEIREMAAEMYKECMRICPEIFENAGPRCWTDKCIEAKPCGNPPKKN